LEVAEPPEWCAAPELPEEPTALEAAELFEAPELLATNAAPRWSPLEEHAPISAKTPKSMPARSLLLAQAGFS
jgi:hypothetical protein